MVSNIVSVCRTEGSENLTIYMCDVDRLSIGAIKDSFWNLCHMIWEENGEEYAWVNTSLPMVTTELDLNCFIWLMQGNRWVEGSVSNDIVEFISSQSIYTLVLANGVLSLRFFTKLLSGHVLWYSLWCVIHLIWEYYNEKGNSLLSFSMWCQIRTHGTIYFSLFATLLSENEVI